MTWIVLLTLFVIYIVVATRVVKKRRAAQDATAVTEATINGAGVTKKRADGTHESVSWPEIHTIELIHRVTDDKSSPQFVVGFLIGKPVPVDEPTLLVFHADDNGAVLPAWPETVDALLIQMRHKCSMNTAELDKVRSRIELRERGQYWLWTSRTES